MNSSAQTPPKTIDDVIRILDAIIVETKNDNSTLGYFAALYQKVTKKVKEGIDNGYFDDAKRMEDLDVIFAARYINAYYLFKNGGKPTESWQEAFALAPKYWPIVLQHLMIGMNVHINLDLGIAAAQVMEGKKIDELKGDFNKINKVLADLVIDVEQSLSAIWPTLGVILKFTGKIDNLLADFSMELARDGAWKFATQIHDKPNSEALIAQRDCKVAKIGLLITKPPLMLRLAFKVIRLGERGSIREKIAKMGNSNN